MALEYGKSFPVTMDEVFPQGALLAGEVEKVKDWDRSSQDRFVQAQQDGVDLWSVLVFDMDPEAKRAATKTVEVWIPAKVQPVPPGAPLTSVVFEGLTAKPKVNNSGQRGRLVWEFRARGMQALNGSKPGPKDGQG